MKCLYFPDKHMFVQSSGYIDIIPRFARARAGAIINDSKGGLTSTSNEDRINLVKHLTIMQII